jgi:hypothetical protein
MLSHEQIMQKGGTAAIEEAGRFFMKEGAVHITLRRITAKLTELDIPHAVAGGMALVAHGYDRTTVDVDVLVDPDGLRRLHQALQGLGYVLPFTGSRNLRDTQTGVRIEFLVAGQFPGDGIPKPVAFPDPAAVSVEIDGIRYIGLPALVELKLASGMTGGIPRLKDLADVVALIQNLELPLEFEHHLNEYVRPKYEELWQGVQNAPPED